MTSHPAPRTPVRMMLRGALVPGMVALPVLAGCLLGVCRRAGRAVRSRGCRDRLRRPRRGPARHHRRGHGSRRHVHGRRRGRLPRPAHPHRRRRGSPCAGWTGSTAAPSPCRPSPRPSSCRSARSSATCARATRSTPARSTGERRHDRRPTAKLPKGVEGHEPFATWHDDPELPSATARADALGATVIAYLLTGPAVFGAIGWGLDRLLGTGFIVVRRASWPGWLCRSTPSGSGTVRRDAPDHRLQATRDSSRDCRVPPPP